MSLLESGPRILPFLWFDANASEAVDFYLTVFKNSRRLNDVRTPESPAGKPAVIAFELEDQRFTALNGGPGHPFTDAISFVVRCESQAEIDDYWAKLSDGGSEVACGWLKDKFGLSWQVVPVHIGELLRHPRAMQAMFTMKKLDIAELERAAQS